MNVEESVQKMLAKAKSDEKGWRKSLDSADGTHSQEVVQENLRRLESLRHTLVNRLASIESRRKQVMRGAIDDGIFTDHNSDGVCEQLLGEGWLERAAPTPPRRHVSRAPAYLPTEKAVEGWNVEVTE